MSWDNRDYSRGENAGGGFGRPGGDWQGLRPSFDNPFSWSVLIARVGGVTVRVHLLFLLFIVARLLTSVFRSESQGDAAPIGLILTAISMGVLFVIVLAHEFGHVLACRWWGGAANEILMWPLGGLAFCRPPQRWRAHLATAVGGPMVNVVLCLLAGGMLWLATRGEGPDSAPFWGFVIPNPLEPFASLYRVGHSYTLITLYFINALSLLLLLFNLLPLYPLDGGRILQALLWPRVGYSRSLRFAVRAGFVGAILLLVMGVVTQNIMVFGIALFGGFVCYQTGKQLEFTEDFMGFEDDEYMIDRFDAQADEAAAPQASARAERRAEKEIKRQVEDAAQIDLILQKIADSGIQSLTGKEKKLLKSETERKRQED